MMGKIRIVSSLEENRRYLLRGFLTNRTLKVIYQGKRVKHGHDVRNFLCFEGPRVYEGAIISIPEDELRTVGKFLFSNNGDVE